MEFQELVDQYGFAAIGVAFVASICFFIVKKLPALLSRGLDILQSHLQEMSEAWKAHRDALDEISERGRNEHTELMKAFQNGQAELIKFLQEQHTALREQIHEHDKHTLNMHNRMNSVLEHVPRSQRDENKLPDNKENTS